MIPPAFQVPADPIQDQVPSTTATSQPQHANSVPELNLNLRSTPLSSLPINFSAGTPSSLSSLPHPHNPPPCTRPVTLGGNAGTLPSPAKEKRTYAQPCKKYTMSPQNSGLGVSGKMDVTPPPPPPSSLNHTTMGMQSFTSGLQSAANKTAPKSQRPPVPSCEAPHACTHAQHVSPAGYTHHMSVS